MIRIDALTKHYGPVVGLDRLSLTVEAGEVVGFLGPNGAGKTTTIRLLLDLLRPTSGHASIGGFDCRRESLQARSLVGYLPGEMPIYPEMTGAGYLDYLGRLSVRQVDSVYLGRLCSRFELRDKDLEKRLRAMSHGTKRKLGIIQALMTRPPVLILDEPTSGLDPLMIEAFASTIEELRNEGRTTVLLSSHVLSEVERTCGRVALIRSGRLAAVESIAGIRQQLPRRATILFREPVDREPVLSPGTRLVHTTPTRWTFEVRGTLGPVLDAVAGLPVSDIDVERTTLEAFVLGIYEKSADAGDSAPVRHPIEVVPASPAPEPAGRGTERVSRPSDAASRSGLTDGEPRRTRQFTALLTRSIQRTALVSGAVALVLAAFQVLLILVAREFQVTRSFDLLGSLMPLGVQQSLGPGALMLGSFSGMVTFGYFHPIIVLAVIQVGVFAATEPAGEVEWGLFDLELSRPVPRRWIVARSLLLSFVVTAVIVVVMMAGTWGGLATLAPSGAPWPSVSLILRLAVHLLAVAWTFSAAGLAVGAMSRRRGSAFARVALITVVLYLLNFLGDAWTPAAKVQWISPFHYFPGFALLQGAVSTWRDLGALAIPTAGLAVVAFLGFSRRDV